MLFQDVLREVIVRFQFSFFTLMLFFVYCWLGIFCFDLFYIDTLKGQKRCFC